MQPDPATVNRAVVQVAVDIQRSSGKPHRGQNNVKREGRVGELLEVVPGQWQRLTGKHGR